MNIKTRKTIGIIFLYLMITGLGILAGYFFERWTNEKKIPASANSTEAVREETVSTEDVPRYTGMVSLNGKTYLYKEDGTKYEEPQWVDYDGEKYYVNSDGALRISELFRVNDAAYYTDTLGRMVRGLFTIDGKLRFFSEDGKMREEPGWLDLDGKRYYIDSSAVVVTGKDHPVRELSSEGIPYIYGYAWADPKDPEGQLGKDNVDARTADQKKEDSETKEASAERPGAGEQIYDIDKIGIYTIDGKDYIFDEKGAMLTGKIRVDKYSFFYTDKKGALLKNQEFTLDGLTYHADASGRVFTGTMYEKADGYSSSTDYLILCNLATQRTAVFEGEKGNWRLLREMLVSTGAPINPTPKGEYQTTVHTEHFNNYGVRAWYATGFIGGLYLFHSSPYESASEPLVCTDGRLGVPLSHGCVRMRVDDARWMFDLLPLSTKVVIYEE